MGTFLFLPILPGFSGSVMAIVSLLTFQSWLDVEAALAGRRPSWAFIPEAAGHDIDRNAHMKYLDSGDRGLTDGGGRTWHGA